MENNTKEEKLYHPHLIRLDDNLNNKLLNHMEENDMTMTGVIRRCLRKYFQNEELVTMTPVKKQSQQV